MDNLMFTVDGKKVTALAGIDIPAFWSRKEFEDYIDVKESGKPIMVKDAGQHERAGASH